MKRCRTVFGALLTAAVACSVSAAGHVNPGTDSAVVLPEPEPREGFTVAILADRTNGYDSGLAVLERAVAELNLLSPELVFHIGDMVPGYTRDLDGKWVQDIERVKDILSSLEAPFFPVAGNHDVITGTGSPLDRRGEDLYRQHFGPLYYSLDYRGSHFVVLYTDEALASKSTLSRDQLDWLRRDLEQSEARHVFVLMHKPLWDTEEYPDSGWEDLRQILDAHPVRAIFGGHYHHYYKGESDDGLPLYGMGVTGGRTFAPEFAGGLEHYALLRVEADSWRLALVKPGSILADDYVSAEDFRRTSKLRLLSAGETGPVGAAISPEGGPVREYVTIAVTNPLDCPLPVRVRGLSDMGHWRFLPGTAAATLGPGARTMFGLQLMSNRVSAQDLAVPEVEIQYDYTDGQGRAVPIPLRRRIPLRRSAKLRTGRTAISVDGRADEPQWREAAVLTTRFWEVSPYESGEEGPAFRLLGSAGGLYLHVASPDEVRSSFRGQRMLSDAVFVGAALPPPAQPSAAPEPPSVVVLFPFAEAGHSQCVQAPWDPRAVMGTKAEGVYLASGGGSGDCGWQCEAFIPWKALGVETAEPGVRLRFNVGAWDNDGELFTEIQSWAPADGGASWGELELTAYAPSAAGPGGS
jgi:hypothetical protein